MTYTTNPGHDAYIRDLAAEEWLETRPICCLCGEHIQEEKAVRFRGEWVCMGCIDDNTQYLEG